MISVNQTFRLFDIVNKYFQNSEDSKIFVSEIEDVMDNKVDLKLGDFATRSDLNELKMALKLDLTQEISNVSIRTEKALKEQLKWIIGVMISLVSITIALNKLF